LEEKAKIKQKFCGNCGSHNAYNYPEQVFCTIRFSEGKDPIVQTLWCCEEWNPSSQECYCVEEAMKKRNKK
jgi:hypothetical protein